MRLDDKMSVASYRAIFEFGFVESSVQLMKQLLVEALPLPHRMWLARGYQMLSNMLTRIDVERMQN